MLLFIIAILILGFVYYFSKEKLARAENLSISACQSKDINFVGVLKDIAREQGKIFGVALVISVFFAFSSFVLLLYTVGLFLLAGWIINQYLKSLCNEIDVFITQKEQASEPQPQSQAEKTDLTATEKTQSATVENSESKENSDKSE